MGAIFRDPALAISRWIKILFAQSSICFYLLKHRQVFGLKREKEKDSVHNSDVQNPLGMGGAGKQHTFLFLF